MIDATFRPIDQWPGNLTPDDVRQRLVKTGDTLTLCEKVMGRRKGEPLVRICDVLVTDVRREPLLAIKPENCVAEGFPQFSPTAFVGFFTNTFGVAEDIDVTVIEWKYL